MSQYLRTSTLNLRSGRPNIIVQKLRARYYSERSIEPHQSAPSIALNAQKLSLTKKLKPPQAKPDDLNHKIAPSMAQNAWKLSLAKKLKPPEAKFRRFPIINRISSPNSLECLEVELDENCRRQSQMGFDNESFKNQNAYFFKLTDLGK